MDNEFERWASGPDEAIDLVDAALAIARDEYPDLEPGPYRARIDALARAADARAGAGAGARQKHAAVDEQLFSIEGFSGNEADYYDPRNSYLNDVLDRRLGIPISLSLLYVEVARRVGLALEPVAFPGHFLVRTAPGDGPLVIDPFRAGMRLRTSQLLALLAPIVGGEAEAVEQLPQYFEPVPRRAVVARMLRNLKAIYAGMEDWPRALRTTDRLVSIVPEAAVELRDRGHCYAKLEAWSAAHADYTSYLERAPGVEDAAEIEALAADLARRAKPLN